MDIKKKREFIIVFQLVVSWILFQISQPILGMFSGVAAVLIIHSLKIKKIRKCILLYCLFILYMAMITYVNIDENYDIKLTCNQLLKMILIIIISYFEFNNLDSRLVFRYIRNIGIVFCILGIIEAILKVQFLKILLGITNIEIRENYRTELIFQSPIICGTYLGFFLCCLILYPLNNKKHQICCLVIEIISLILNQSRSAWIAVLVAVFCLELKKYNHNIIGVVKNILKLTLEKIIVFICAITILVFDILSGKNTIIGKLENILLRVATTFDAGEGKIIRLETMSKSMDYWFGGHIGRFIWGGGKNFDKVFLSANPIVKGNEGFVWNACLDNQYFTWIHESGIVGFGILVIVFLIMLNHFQHCSREKRETIHLFCLLVYFSVNMFFYEAYNYPQILILLNMLIVLWDYRIVEKREKMV